MKTDQDNIEAEIGRIEANIDAAKKALKDDGVSPREMVITVLVFAIVIAALVYLYHRLLPHLDGDSLQAITWFTLAVAIFGFWIYWKIRCRADMRKMEHDERLLAEHLANKGVMHTLHPPHASCESRSRASGSGSAQR